MTKPRLPLITCGLACLLLTLAGATGCAQQERTAGRAARVERSPQPPLTLQQRLDDYQARWRVTVGPERAKLHDDFVAELRAAGIADRALHAGAHAPPFELPGVSGAPVALADLLRAGPVVLLWYRGGWSPQCAITLREYAQALPEIQALGATLVAISPQTVDNSQMTQQLGQFDFELLSDAGNQVARKFGLVCKLPPAVLADLHPEFDLREYNGDASGELPLTATYVIDRDGVIRYAFVDPDYRKRAEPAEVIAALKSLAAGPAEKPGATSRLRLHYNITLRPPAERKVDVVACIDGLDPGCAALPLKMAEDWAFVRLPEPLLEGPVRATAGGQALAIEHPAPYAWTIRSAGHTSIELRYSVPLTHREHEAVRSRHDEFEYPFVAGDYALLPTATLILYPADFHAGETRVRLNVPLGWDICAPWQRLPDGEFDPGSQDAAANDLLAVGRWNRHEIRVGDFVGTISFVPGQEEIEDGAAGVIRRIVEHELQLFGRPAQGQYLFLFGPPIERGMAGSPKTHSMVLAVDPQMRSRGEHHLAHLIAHEFFHTWAHSIGELPDELRWLNEGITDYYAYLISARLGLLSWEQFAGTLAEMMLTATNNRHVGQMSLVEAGGPAFFTDPDAYDLVYAGGMLVGAWLDCAIRAEGHGQSLDDLMRALLNDPRWVPNERGPHVTDVVTLLPCFVSADLARQAEEAICQPYHFDPVAALGPLGVTVTPRTDPAHLNLQANFDGTRITNIDHKDLAYRAGVRENDRVVEVNGRPVASPADVHAAWRDPQDGRVRVVLLRGAERIELDQPLPPVLGYEVAAEPWRTHMAGHAALAESVAAGEDER